MIKIREYKPEEYKMVSKWWKSSGEPVPPAHLIPETTFIAEIDEKPAVCVSIICTNISIAWLEGLVGNPGLKSNKRTAAVNKLFNFCQEFSKKRDYKYVFCLSENEKLKKYFRALGFSPTLNGVTTFAKEL